MAEQFIPEKPQGEQAPAEKLFTEKKAVASGVVFMVLSLLGLGATIALGVTSLPFILFSAVSIIWAGWLIMLAPEFLGRLDNFKSGPGTMMQIVVMLAFPAVLVSVVITYAIFGSWFQGLAVIRGHGASLLHMIGSAAGIIVASIISSSVSIVSMLKVLQGMFLDVENRAARMGLPRYYNENAKTEEKKNKPRVKGMAESFTPGKTQGQLAAEKGFKPLKFGTSGLRDLAKNMTDMECYINVLGYIQFLKKNNEIAAGETFTIAGDLRPTTERILKAVAKAAEDEGLVVEYIGRVPTPTVAFYAMQKGRACAMITASHNPVQENGIKFYKKSGEVLKEDEAGILSSVAEVRQAENARAVGSGQFDENFMFKTSPELNEAQTAQAAVEMYVQRYLSVFPSDALKGKKVVVDQHSAVGREILARILGRPGGRGDPRKLERHVRGQGFGKRDPGGGGRVQGFGGQAPTVRGRVLDGDSDRPFVVDGEGCFSFRRLAGSRDRQVPGRGLCGSAGYGQPGDRTRHEAGEYSDILHQNRVAVCDQGHVECHIQRIQAGHVVGTQWRLPARKRYPD